MIDHLLGGPPAEDWRMYVPVLRAKASEWKALAALSPGVRQRVAPIIEFVPGWRGPGSSTTTRKRRAPQTPGEYVRRMLEAAAHSTSGKTRSFVYFGHAGANANWSGVGLWAAFVSTVPSECGVVPLVDLDAVSGSASVPAAVQHADGDFSLRIVANELNSSLAGRIHGAIRQAGATAGTTHVIIDLKDNPTAASHNQIRRVVGNTDAFASVVVLAGVFPFDLTQYQTGVAAEGRIEWHTWWREHQATQVDDRFLSFGDYTTQCAHYRPSPAVPGSVSLRYTTDAAILVFRGSQANSRAGLGYEQIHGHCRLLVGRQDYDGAVFSAGDQRIYCWTDPSHGPGNPEQWRTACLVHHITHVVTQVQDAAGSSATIRAWARSQPPPTCP